jgi:hypothetical protein
MSHEVFEHGNVLVVVESPVEMSNDVRAANPEAKHFHDMKNGAIGGAIVGAVYGAATLALFVEAALRSPFEASLLLSFSALGGVLLGGIIGSTGIFARSHKL